MRRALALAAAVVAIVVVALVVAQLLLPGIAAQRLRDRLSAHGQVVSVHVHAFPAIELLWHHADRVTIAMRSYRTGGGGSLGASLAQAGDVGTLHATADTVAAGVLRVREATLDAHDGRLRASGTVDEADLRGAVPILSSVTPVASAQGQLTLRGTADVLGVQTTVDATLRATQGKLVISPDVPLGGLATVTVFSDPHVDVHEVSARTTARGSTLHATGTVR